MFYVINFFVLLLYGIVLYNIKSENSEKINEKRKIDKIFLFFSGLHMFLIMALRGSTVGTDTKTYINLYNIISKNNQLSLPSLMRIYSAFEKAPLWTFMMKWLSRMTGGDSQAYLIFTGLFIISVFWYAIYYSKAKCFPAVVLYYLILFLPSLNGTRTYMAVALVLLGYLLSENKKRISSVIVFIFAVLIHNTALVGVLFIGLTYVNFKSKIVRKVLVAAIILGVLFYQRIISIFTILFPVYSDTLERVDDSVAGRNIVIQIIYLVCIFQTVKYIKKHRDANSHDVIDIRRANVLMICEVAVAIVGIRLWYMQRILSYFQSIILILWPTVSVTRHKYYKIYKFILYGAAFLFFVYRLIRNMGSPLPYIFFWKM